MAIAHLALGQEGLLDFDTNWKQVPPLGSEEDQKALIGGLCDGSIDAVVSDHHPVNVEQKKSVPTKRLKKGSPAYRRRIPYCVLFPG